MLTATLLPRLTPSAFFSLTGGDSNSTTTSLSCWTYVSYGDCKGMPHLVDLHEKPVVESSAVSAKNTGNGICQKTLDICERS